MDRPSPPRGGFCVLGGKLHLHDWGGKGPAALLLHGMMGNAHWWDLAAPRVSGARPIGVDLRGHGGSARVDGEDAYSSIDRFVEDVEAAVAELGLREYFIAAHSFGARVALAYAARKPAGLRGVAALDFLCEFTRRDIGHIVRARRRPSPSYPSKEEILRRFRLEPGGTVLSPQALRELGENCIRQTPDGRWEWKFDWRLFTHAYTPVWPVLPDIRAPLLVLHGERSPMMAPEHLERLRREGHAEIRMVKGAFHHVPLDAPGETAELLSDFFARF